MTTGKDSRDEFQGITAGALGRPAGSDAQLRDGGQGDPQTAGPTATRGHGGDSAEGVDQRVILLCDLDAFFAAVEILDRPDLRGRPVLVGGNPDGRGVVATCSYEARKYGIHSAMPMAEARRRCPEAVILPTRHHRYREVSDQVFSIFLRHTSDVEAVSIDEAYLDVTGRSGLEVGRSIRKAVREEIGLTISIGVSHNKFLAKTACELAKPDGLGFIGKDEINDVLAPLPVESILGIGPRTGAFMRQEGIATIGDLQSRSRRWLVKEFGRRGEDFYLLARGIDYRPVSQGGPAKSISEETTFPVDRRSGELLPDLAHMARRVGSRLRRSEMMASTVTIKVRFPNFVTITRSRTLPVPTDTDTAILDTARSLYEQHILMSGGRPPNHRDWAGTGGLPPLVRLLGVGVSNLVDAGVPIQMSLWEARP